MRKVYDGKLLKVFVKKVRLPNGYRATFELIQHPGASLIIPFLSKREIIMLRQLRPVINSFIYELPAGTLDRGETSLACARRESIDETGYAARKFTSLGRIFPVPGYSTEKITIYKAEGLTRRARIAERDEILRNHIFTKGAVKTLVKSGRIVDAKTICALSMCGWV